MPSFVRPLIFLAFATPPPSQRDHLRNLSQESRQLEDIFNRNVGPEKKAWFREPHATVDDIFKAFRQYRNRIVLFHYGGHADSYNLFLDTPEGKNAPANAKSLADFLTGQQGLHLVFLNACATQPQVEALHQAGIPVVVATRRTVDDAVATEFAGQFYRSLTSGVTVKQAFAEAAATVKTKWGPDWRGLYYANAPELALEEAPYPWILSPEEGAVVDWRLPRSHRQGYLAAGISGLLLVILLVLYFLLRPKPLPDGFNVGVAKFSSLDPNITEAEAENLSNFLYESLAGEEGVVTKSLEEELNSDAPVHFLGPADLGQLKGETEEELTSQAAWLVEKRNLSILIYGSLRRNESGFYMQPTFFLPENDERIDYGREVGGPTQFGAPIPLKLPFSSGELSQQSDALRGRTFALGHTLLALYDFYRERYPEAIQDFQRALAPEYWSTVSGREVIHLLQGATFIRQNNLENPGTQAQAEALSQAETAFREAYNLNPHYARPYLGLGTVSLEQAKIMSPDGAAIERLNEPKLREAEDWYRGSQSSLITEAPPLAYVPVKANYGLGLVYRLNYEHHNPDPSLWQASQGYFQQVVSASAGIPALAWFEGNALIQLCTLETLRFVKAQEVVDWPAAEQQCREGITILEDVNSARRSLPEYRTTLGFVIAQQPEKGDEECSYYQAAIDEAKVYGWPAAWITKVESAMLALDCP